MLDWSAEAVTEITVEHLELEFTPILRNVERGAPDLVFVLQQMHTALMALTSYKAKDLVAYSRKNPVEAWRRLQKRDDPTTGGRKRNLLRTIIFLDDALCWNIKLVSNEENPTRRATRETVEGHTMLEELENI